MEPSSLNLAQGLDADRRSQGTYAVDTNILVSVGKSAGRDVLDVSTDLAEAGMKIIDVLKLTRVVTGTVDESRIPKLREVPGVTSVDLDVELSAE